jgi:hypothetical protein
MRPCLSLDQRESLPEVRRIPGLWVRERISSSRRFQFFYQLLAAICINPMVRNSVDNALRLAPGVSPFGGAH